MITKRINPDKLRKLRKDAGYRSQDFAKKCGIPEGTYFAYESGQRSTHGDRLQIIADALGVSVEDFTDELPQQEETRKHGIERLEIDTYYLRFKRIQVYGSGAKMAKASMLATSSYYEIERGEVNPTRIVIRHMCDALGVRFDQLVKD